MAEESEFTESPSSKPIRYLSVKTEGACSKLFLFVQKI